MVRLSILFASLSMVLALGVWDSAEAEAKRFGSRVKLRSTTCPHFPSGQRYGLEHTMKIKTPGFKGEKLRVSKPVTTFISATISRKWRLICRYKITKDNSSMFAEIMAGSGPGIANKYKCTPGKGFSISSKGTKCTKKKAGHCHAICKRKAERGEK